MTRWYSTSENASCSNVDHRTAARERRTALPISHTRSDAREQCHRRTLAPSKGRLATTMAMPQYVQALGWSTRKGCGAWSKIVLAVAGATPWISHQGVSTTHRRATTTGFAWSAGKRTSSGTLRTQAHSTNRATFPEMPGREGSMRQAWPLSTQGTLISAEQHQRPQPRPGTLHRAGQRVPPPAAPAALTAGRVATWGAESHGLCRSGDALAGLAGS